MACGLKPRVFQPSGSVLLFQVHFHLAHIEHHALKVARGIRQPHFQLGGISIFGRF